MSERNLRTTPVSWRHYTDTLDMFPSTMGWSDNRRKNMYEQYCHNIENGLFPREQFWVQKDHEGNVVERVRIPDRFLQEEASLIALEEHVNASQYEINTVEDMVEDDSVDVTPVDPPLTDIDVCKKLLQISKSAGQRNIEFGLTFTAVKNIMRAKKCYFTGEPIFRTVDDQHVSKMTIDRLDPDKGYVVGNCVASSYHANRLKSLFERELSEEMTSKEKQKMLAKMLRC